MDNKVDVLENSCGYLLWFHFILYVLQFQWPKTNSLCARHLFIVQRPVIRFASKLKWILRRINAAYIWSLHNGTIAVALELISCESGRMQISRNGKCLNWWIMTATTVTSDPNSISILQPTRNELVVNNKIIKWNPLIESFIFAFIFVDWLMMVSVVTMSQDYCKGVECVQVKIGNYIIHCPSVRPQICVFDGIRHVNQWWICTSPSNSPSKTDNYYFRVSHVSHGSETEETKIHHLRILMRTYTGKKLDPSLMRFWDNDSCSPSVSLAERTTCATTTTTAAKKKPAINYVR